LGFWVGSFNGFPEDPNFPQRGKITLAIKKVSHDTISAQLLFLGSEQKITGKIWNYGGQTKIGFYKLTKHKSTDSLTFKLLGFELVGEVAYQKMGRKIVYPLRLKFEKFQYNPAVMLDSLRDYSDFDNPQTRTKFDTLKNGKVVEWGDEYYKAASADAVRINSSTHALKEAELKNLKKLDLEILRNTIYARHGYSFGDKFYSSLFNRVTWYVPVTDKVDAELTEIERNNIKLLARFEKYAKDNYVSYGR
jgi:hypothetical protein